MTKQQLIDSLTAVQPRDTVQDIDCDGYIDWSFRSEQSDRRAFEVGGGDGDMVTLWVTRDDLLRLHAALTLTLLADAEA